MVEKKDEGPTYKVKNDMNPKGNLLEISLTGNNPEVLGAYSKFIADAVVRKLGKGKVKSYEIMSVSGIDPKGHEYTELRAVLRFNGAAKDYYKKLLKSK